MPKVMDDLLPYVLPDLPGVSEQQAATALVSAMIDLCERSLVLQRDHDAINVVADKGVYDLDAPTGYVVHKVMKAWYRTSPIWPALPDDMDDAHLYHARVGGPVAFVHRGERTISLYPVPSETVDRGLTLRMAIKPKRDVVNIDDELYEDYIEVIAAGAKAKLQITPGKPFTNPQMAGFNQGLFTAGINRAMLRANKGHSRANLSVRMRRI